MPAARPIIQTIRSRNVARQGIPRTIGSTDQDKWPSAGKITVPDDVGMGKYLLIATCWGLATWTWLSMAAVLLPIPNLGLIGGGLTAVAILGRFVASSSHAAVDSSRQVAESN